MNLVDGSLKDNDAAAAGPQPPPQASPSTQDAAAAAAAAARPTARPPSIKKRVADKASRYRFPPTCGSVCDRETLQIASHVASVAELLEGNEDNFHVEFANDAIRIFQGIATGQCIPGPLISNLNNLCFLHVDDVDAGTQALLLLGRALRKAAESRNEEITVSEGLKVGKYGLPELLPPKPPMARTSSESAESGEQSAVIRRERRGKPFLFDDRKIKIEEPDVIIKEEEVEFVNGCITYGSYIGPNASYVDIANLPPISFPIKQINHVSELRMTERRMPVEKHRAANAPFKPFELQFDDAGNPLVKSEMMGDDDFFDHQINQRKIALKYEQVARKGLYEERFIMRHIASGYKKHRYECDFCGIICQNQHKYASHVRHAHPKTKAERAAELKEEKRIRDELNPRVPREKRERRTALARKQSGTNLTATTAAPAADKIYVCPICNEEVASQHVFASHMRYNHPKDNTNTSMVGRRATVKRVAKEDVFDAPVKIDTPESALHALSSVLSATKPAAPTVRRTKTNPDGTGAYKCRVCGRVFDNLNACAGHTRHCIAAHNAAPSPPKPAPQKTTAARPPPAAPVVVEERMDEGATEDDDEDAEGTYECRVCHKLFNNPNSVAGHTRHCLALNGGDPSPRALARRKAKTQPMPTFIIKTEPLPSTSSSTGAKVAPAASSSSAEPEVSRVSRASKSAVPSQPAAAVPAKIVKVEPADETAKPIGRTTRNSAATALEPAPSAIELPASLSGRRATRSSIGPAATAAPAAPATPATPAALDGIVTSTPSTSRLSTRSSRSSAPLRPETPSDAPPIASKAFLDLLPPVKRSRTALGHNDRDIKREPTEDDDTKTSIKQESVDDDQSGSPKKRLSKGDKKAAMVANRGFDTEAARTCYYCHIRLNTFHAGDRHIRMKHSGREQIYACSSCKAPFLTLGGLENHWTKGEHCPQGTVVVAGRCIFDLEKEVLLRPEEVKLKGLDLSEDGEIAVKEAAEVGHTKVDQPVSKSQEEKTKKVVEHKEEKKVEKPSEKKEAEKFEKTTERKEEKKIEKTTEKKVEKPAEKEKRMEQPSQKKEDKPVENITEKKEEAKVATTIEKKDDKRMEKAVEKIQEKKDNPVEKMEKKLEKKDEKMEKPLEKKVEKKEEKKVEKIVEKKEEKKEEKKIEKPVEKKEERKVEKKEEKKVEKPDETIERKEEKKVDKKMEKPVEKKEEKREEKKTEKPLEKKVEKKDEKKVDKPVEKKGEKHVEKKEDKKVEKKEEKKEEKKVEKTVEKKEEKKIEKKEEKKEEKKVEKTVEKKEEKKIEKKEEKKEDKKATEKRVEKKEVEKSPRTKEDPKKDERKSEKEKKEPEEKKSPAVASKPAKRSRTRDSDESESRPGSSAAPAVISLAVGRSGANRQRKPADRFDPTPITNSTPK
ncbi:hypothetical protein PRIPAC_97395 [Pristionchus pacificus]|uniref:Uncharacterized protein n=1 Tax=Pristionchus pacificus TaxID=54126 RepID=A0A2A6D2M9_PRIPA|nr:hypothetical protein PRIPAC_97395 [Pristionchus pacificus]|eukprot:PDM84567.1 hypothetical protein PRIPAC_33590 [Pristionchus pacificus]